MEEPHDLGQRLKSALDPGPGFPSETLLPRTVAALEERGRRSPVRLLRPIAAGIGAVVVAVAVVGMFVFLPRQGSAPRPASAQVVPYSGNLRNPEMGMVGSLQFVSAQTGWLVRSTAAESVVWKTSDGGRTWADQLELHYFGIGAVRLQMLDEKRGVLVAAVDRPARIYRTDDGGQSWSSVQGPAIGQLAGLFFISQDEGWVLAQGPSQPERCGGSDCAIPGAPILYRVSGGGRNWQRLGIPDPWAVPSLTFTDGSHGWLGSFLMGPDLQRPFLLRTSDGGSTWKRQDLAPPATLSGSQALVEGPRFFGSNRGVAVLRGNRSFAYTTADGGKSWMGPVDLPLNGPLTSTDGTRWVQLAAGANSELASAASLTGSWTRRPLSVPAGWSAFQVASAGARDEWVVLLGAGPSFALVHSADGGAQWSEVGLPRGVPGPMQPTAGTAATPSDAVARDTVALLANNHLVLVPPGGTAPKWELVLGREPDPSASHGYLGTGHRLAWSLDRATLYALPATDYRSATQLSVVDVATGRVTRTLALPQDAKIGSLAVGPDGRVYLVGRQSTVIAIAVYDPGQGKITQTWQGRNMSHWGEFQIYGAQFSPDGRRLYYSYTGGQIPQAGVDWVELQGQNISLCSPPDPTSACMKGLAGFRLLGDEVLVTTGVDALDGLVYRYQPDGRRVGEYHLSLGAGFLNDFALDEASQQLFAIGSCGYTAGMSVLALSTAQATVLVAPTRGQHGPDAICGQRLELLGPGELVVGRVAALGATPTSRGTLLYIHTRNGSVVRRVEVSAEPLDVAAR